jgi:hypothetical protein
VFTVLDSYGDTTGPGSYSISYDPSDPAGHDDLITTDDPVPGGAAQECASPVGYGLPTCITDDQLQTEIAHVVTAGGLATGLGNVYFVFLPPNVDTCLGPGACGTNSFGGYHSLSDLGQGPGTTAIYANIPDPAIEFDPSVFDDAFPDLGSAPVGGEAGEAIDTSAHELIEAITDPLGTAWMDPNGYEVADRCEDAPSSGVPVGTSADGAQYDQVINGDEYEIQEIWSDATASCVQGSTASGDGLPLPQVRLTQFGSLVTGTIPSAASGVRVTVSLVRAGVSVSSASATTSSGAWSLSLPGHAVGDDRDTIEVDYTGAGAPSPSRQTILTGNGGDADAESGWTGWSELDAGTSVLRASNPAHLAAGVLVQPCFQTGVISLAFDGKPLAMGVCDSESDESLTAVAVRPADSVTVSSDDNRAFFVGPSSRPADLEGGMVDLTVTAPEAGATGFPSCSGDVELNLVTCTGLVAKAPYALSRLRAGAHTLTVHATSDPSGTLVAGFAGPTGLHGGDLVRLVNSAGRTVSTLHLADLQVALVGDAGVIAAGRCQPGEYFGPAATLGTSSTSAGSLGSGGPAGTGTICPLDGDAAGLPAGEISQTDEWSGGQTVTEVPALATTTPLDGEVLYGPFRAVATAALPGPAGTSLPNDATVAVAITPSSGGRPVFSAADVDTTAGVGVAALRAGTYRCTWTLTDANGDTRTVTTRFVEEPSR